MRRAPRHLLILPAVVVGLTAAAAAAAEPSSSEPLSTKPAAVSFTNEVMAVLGKAGCNSGPCHGHNTGKGGFKLSLRGYFPDQDHRELVRGQMGRRIDREVPAASLLLLKASGGLRHGGSKRFEPESEFYEVLRRWIAEGARSDFGTAVKLERIAVSPASERLEPGQARRLQVTARFADGVSSRDVTDQALYELSSEGSLEVGPEGLVTAKREGEAAVLVRFLGMMGLAEFSVVRPKPDFAWSDPPVHNLVDTHIHEKLRSIQVLPSDLASDAEFLRRATFDTTGLPPEPEEVRAFLADAAADKRARKINELLEREAFGDIWAAYWLEMSGTHEGGDSARFKGTWALSFWLRDAIARNMPYDEFVRALVAGRGSSLENPGITFGLNRLPKQETVAELFLGVRLECAQCHDHPFDVWKQADYRALGEFFADLGAKEGPHDSYSAEGVRFTAPEKFLPWERGKTVRSGCPTEPPLTCPWSAIGARRVVDWMFGSGRRLTARALVNRTWGKLLGRGIVEPVDDMRFSNPAVNEPLLDALADDFVAHDYDFKHLVRTILNSRTYQLSSVTNATNAGDELNFSHAYVRRLSAEQMLDAVTQVSGVEESYGLGPPGLRAVQIPYQKINSRFLAMFGRPPERKSACTCIRSQETTLPQVLHLINGDTIGTRLRSEGSSLNRLLAMNLPADRLVEELYLRVLSRLPDDRERRLAGEYLAASGDRAEGAEDLMWALLSSQEFLFNH